MTTLLLAALLQEDLMPEGKFSEIKTGDRSKQHYVNVSVESNLPRRAVLSVEAGTAAYVYVFTDNYFALQPPDVFFPYRQIGKVADGGGCKHVKIDLPRAGIYQVRARFERARQDDPERMKNALGRWYGDRVLAEAVVPVGVETAVFKELVDDSTICRKVVDDAYKAVEDLIEAADSGADNWEPKAIKILEDLTKIEEKLNQRVDETLLKATYRYLSEVLMNVQMSKQLIQAFYDAKKAKEKEGGAGSFGSSAAEWEDNEAGLDVEHKDDEAAGDGAPPSAVGGGRLSFKRMKNQLERGAEVRARETTLWAIQFADLGLKNLLAAAARLRAGESASVAAEDETIQGALKSFRGIGDVTSAFASDKDFEPFWAIDKETPRFDDLPRLLTAYHVALVEELTRSPKAEENQTLREQREQIEKLLEQYDEKNKGKAPD